MAVTFSYANFRNLWDMILAAAEHETQLALRLVCKSLRFKVDCLQARHLVISSEGAKQLLITGPNHHIAHFRDIYHLDKEPRFWSFHATRARTRHTRILDIQGYCPPGNDPDLFTYMQFPHLNVLRMTPSVDDDPDNFTPYIPGHFEAQTLVLFSNSEGCAAMDDHWWFDLYAPSDDDEELPLVPPVNRSRIPQSVTKMVLNLRGQNMELHDMYPFVTRLPAHVKDVVISAPAYRSLLNTAGVRNEVSPHLTKLRLVDVVLLPIKTKFTLVDFNWLGPSFEKEFLDELRYRYRSFFFKDVDYTVDDDMTRVMQRKTRDECIKRSTTVEVTRKPLISLQEQIDKLLSRIEFLSKEAYIERVGAETAALDLLEHLDLENSDCVEGEYDWRSKRACYGTQSQPDYWHQMRTPPA